MNSLLHYNTSFQYSSSNSCLLTIKPQKSAYRKRFWRVFFNSTGTIIKKWRVRSHTFYKWEIRLFAVLKQLVLQKSNSNSKWKDQEVWGWISIWDSSNTCSRALVFMFLGCVSFDTIAKNITFSRATSPGRKNYEDTIGIFLLQIRMSSNTTTWNFREYNGRIRRASQRELKRKLTERMLGTLRALKAVWNPRVLLLGVRVYLWRCLFWFVTLDVYNHLWWVLQKDSVVTLNST